MHLGTPKYWGEPPAPASPRFLKASSQLGTTPSPSPQMLRSCTSSQKPLKKAPSLSLTLTGYGSPAAVQSKSLQ